ncbi:MAG: glycosyltransferase family 2 protein [Actinobacteria bacterium]|nr:glycosyltransferase family 2 protein [Actinomycetota bacterium]
MRQPTIATVIPTIGRLELRRAIESVLAQSRKVDEIIVVADTDEELDLPVGKDIVTLRVGPGAGGNVARQRGIEFATSDLVALLDDDDEWEVHRLERQVDLIPEGLGQDWIVSSFLEARLDNGKTETWPDRAIGPTETIPEYIFRKHSVRAGMGYIQASTLLFPRLLGLAIPFDPALRFHQDISWLNDVSTARPGVRLIQVPEPLVRHFIQAGSVSKKISAEQSLGWAFEHLSSDGRTFGDFVLTHSLHAAANSGNILRIIQTAMQAGIHGKPGRPAVLYACAFTLQFSLRQLAIAVRLLFKTILRKRCASPAGIIVAPLRPRKI